MAGFRIIRATMADRPRVVDFLKEAFFKDRVLNISLGMVGEPSEEEINHSLQSFPQGNSLLAVTNENKLVGVVINGEITENEVNVRQKMLDECKCKDFGVLLKFWVDVESLANFWKNTDETKAYDIKLVAVDFHARGQGIANLLFLRSKELGKEAGYKICRADCSSYYAGKLALLQGMTCVYEMRYEDYKDKNGDVVFKVPTPHDAFRIFKENL